MFVCAALRCCRCRILPCRFWWCLGRNREEIWLQKLFLVGIFFPFSSFHFFMGLTRCSWDLLRIRTRIVRKSPQLRSHTSPWGRKFKTHIVFISTGFTANYAQLALFLHFPQPSEPSETQGNKNPKMRSSFYLLSLFFNFLKTKVRPHLLHL